MVVTACTVTHTTETTLYDANGCVIGRKLVTDTWDVDVDNIEIVIGPFTIKEKVVNPKPGTIIQFPDGSYGFVPENDPTHYYPITPKSATGTGSTPPSGYNPQGSGGGTGTTPPGDSAVSVLSLCDVVTDSIELVDIVDYNPSTGLVSWVEPHPENLPANVPQAHLSWSVDGQGRTWVVADAFGLGWAMVHGRVGRIENQYATVELQVLNTYLQNSNGTWTHMVLTFTKWTTPTERCVSP